MAEFRADGKALDRRGFLKGSALFAAAAVGMMAGAPVFAQEPQQSKPEEKKPEESKPAEPATDQAKKEEAPARKDDPNKLVDKNGREYRVCERCGGNMYKEGTTWTCDQCGLSYVE
jgi:anaerobic selenocysteine-containing dehydrogenase